MRDLVQMVGRFSLTGILNTAVGFLVIFACMFAGLNPLISNVVGYAAGLILSFALQRGWVFRDQSSLSQQVRRYAASVTVAYLCNLAMLWSLLGLKMSPYVAQIFSATTYTILLFLLSSNWVFRGHARQQ
jgi:putative flippase GtrA